MRKRSWLAGCGCGTGLVVVGLALGGYAWLQSSKGEGFLEKQVESTVRASLEAGGFEIGDLRLQGRDLWLDDLVIEGAGGEGRVQIGSVRTKLKLRSLVKGKVVLRDLVIADIDVVLPRRDDGALDLPTFTPSTTPGPTTYMPPGFTLIAQGARIERVNVSLPDDDLTLSDLGGGLNLVADHDRVAVDGLSLKAEVPSPALGRTNLDGYLHLHHDDLARMDLSLETGDSRLVAGGSVPGLLGDALAFDLDAAGSLDRPTLKTVLAWSGNGDAAAQLRDGGPIDVETSVDGDLEAIQLEQLAVGLGEARVLEADGRICLVEACGGPEATLDLLSPEPNPLFAELQLEGTARRVAFPVTVRFPTEGPVTVDGKLSAEGLTYGGTVAVPRAELSIAGPVTEGMALRVQGRIPTVRMIGEQPVATSAAIDLTVSEQDVRGGMTLRPQTDVDAVVRSRFAFGFESGALRLTDTVATVEETRIAGEGPITARVVEGGLQDVHAVVRVGEEGVLTADLDVVTAATQRGRVEAEAIALGQLGKLASAFAPDLPSIEGRLDGVVALEGARRGTVELEARQLAVEDILEPTTIRLNGALDGDRITATVEALDRKEDQPLVVAELASSLPSDGFAPTCDDTVEVTVTLAEQELTELGNHVVALADPPVRGTVKGKLGLDGSFCDPKIALDGSMDGLYGEEPLHLEAKVTDGPEHESVVIASVDMGDQRVADLEAHLEHPRPDAWLAAEDPVAELGGWTANAKVANLSVATFTAGIEGTVVGDFDAKGQGLEPEAVEGRLAIEGAALEGRALDEVAMTLATVDGHLELAAKVAATGDASLDANARAPLDELLRKGMDTSFTAEVEPSRVPLALIAGFLPMYFREGEGVLAMEASASGTFADPKLAGSMDLENGQVVVVPTGIRYSEIQLAARFADDELRIERAEMASRPRYGRFARREAARSLSLTGTVGFHDGAVTPDLSAELADFWAVATNQAVVQMTGDLQVAGSLTEPDIKGDIRMDQARFDLDRYVFIPAAGTRLHPEITFVGERPERLQPPDTEPSLLETADVAVSIDAGRSAQLEATVPLAADAGLIGSVSDLEVNTELEGAVDVAVQDGQPSVEGRIEAQGSAKLLSARFDVEQGTVAFEGQSYTSPRLDFTLRRANDDIGAVTARVRGTPESLTIDELTSDAGLSQADIMATLLFGRPLSTLDSSQAGAGANVVQRTLASVAGGQLEDAIGIELVDSIEVGSDSVAVGWAISDAGFLTLKLDPTAEPTENTTEVEVSIFLGAIAEAEITTGDKADSSVWLLAEENF